LSRLEPNSVAKVEVADTGLITSWACIYVATKKSAVHVKRVIFFIINIFYRLKALLLSVNVIEEIPF
jgi:hypothetical protein